MGTDRLSFEEQMEKDPFDDNDDLASILKEYETLTDIQEEERQELLHRIDEITRRTQKLDSIDAKLDQFTSLLLDIRTQLTGKTDTDKKKNNQNIPVPKIPIQPEVLASKEEIETLTEEVDRKSEDLDEEISALTHLVEKKNDMIKDKDRRIEELNTRLDLLSDEKTRLANELENLNSVIDSWKSQLDLLQQLASSDPRYRVIEALKKHGSLSDIQLAFTMGTSINQLRKYIEDLIDLNLVEKSSSGRYIWTGKEFDTEIA